MLKQRWVSLLFGGLVHVVRAAQVARASMAGFVLPGLVLAAAGAIIVHLQPDDHRARMLATISEQRLPLAAHEAPGAPVVEEPVLVTPVPDRRVSMIAPPRLNREQLNIARFIAKRYQVAMDEVQHFVAYAYKAAGEVKLDPMLILAVISVESSFDPAAQSPAGAQGLMQVLTRVHAEKFAPFGGVAAAFDPAANIRVGARILREYVARQGSVEAALKSYVGAAVQPDDAGYGSKVLFERQRIAAAAAGKPIPEAPPPPAPASTITEKVEPLPDPAAAFLREIDAPAATVRQAIPRIDADASGAAGSRAAEAPMRGDLLASERPPAVTDR